MLLGKNGKWSWISYRGQAMWDVISLCPAIVLNRFVAVTAFDGTPLSLSKTELSNGWKYLYEHAISPRIVDPKQLTSEQYDEWYIFPDTPNIKIDQVFINYCGFRLTTGHVGFNDLAGIPEEPQFWEQLNVVQPHSYIAEGDNFVFVTSDDALFEQAVIITQNVEFEEG